MWPDYFPEQCPPVDARKDELAVFRLVSNNPPTSGDFLPTIKESPPHRDFSDEVLCIACGVSVFKNIDDIVKKRTRYKALRDKKVARGIIMPNDGLVKETFGLSHVTWWLQTEEPHATFFEVENVT